MAPRVAISILCLTIAGCGRDQPPAPPAAKAATVASPVKEAQLTTVTLSEEAERRLAVKTELVEQRAVPRTRTLGGEIMAPSGMALAITAPVAGTLQGTSFVPTAGAAVTRGQAVFRLVPIQPSERDAGVTAQQAAGHRRGPARCRRARVQRAERLVKDGSGEPPIVGGGAGGSGGGGSGVEGRARPCGAGDAKRRVERRCRHRSARRRHRAERFRSRRSGRFRRHGPLELVRLATVWVRVPVYAGEIRALDTAAPAQVQRLGEEAEAAGVTARPIAAPPSANPATAGVDLYYALPNPNNRFRPGERVAVRLSRRESETGLVVPKAALLHDAYGGTWVYVARQPQVYARERVVVTDITGDACRAVARTRRWRTGGDRWRGGAVRHRVRRRKVDPS